MKQGKPLITLVILILAATVAIYFAAYIYNALDDTSQRPHHVM